MQSDKYVIADSKVHIHLVEDDQDDVHLLKRALSDHLSEFEVHIHENGREALDTLTQSSGSSSTVDLVLLDINMPVMNGYEFLTRFREIDHFRLVPTVVITTANDPDSIKKAYECGANSVITKQKLFDSTANLVQLMVDYWLELTERPRLRTAV